MVFCRDWVSALSREPSTQLAEAARIIIETLGALHLRTLQTMSEVATEKNSTLVLPIPVELLEGFKQIGEAVKRLNS